MPGFDAKPDEQFIKNLDKHLGNVWQKTHEKLVKVDRYYNGTFPLWDQAQEKNLTRPEYHPGTARHVIDHAADTQIAYDPQVTRQPVGTGDTHEDDAGDVENWVKAVLRDSALKEPDLPWKRGGKNLIGYGYNIFEGPVLDLTGEPKKPKKGEADFTDKMKLYEEQMVGWNPFRIRCPNPSRILLNPYEKVSTIALKRSKHYSHELHTITTNMDKRKAIILKQWEMGDDWYKLHDTFEVWTPHWQALMAKEGGMVFLRKNTWGFVPDSQAYSGWGYEPTELNEVDPSFMAAGILEGTFESLKVQAQSRTGKHEALMRATFSKLGSTKDPTVAAAELDGDVLHGKKTDYWWMDNQEMPRFITEEDAWIERAIEKGTFSTILWGERQPGVTTVGATAIMSTNANRKFGAPAEQLDNQVSIIASNILRLFVKMGKTMTIDGFTLRPEQVHENYNIRVHFELLDPVLHLQEKEFGLREYQAGVRSRESYWEIARITDSAQEDDRLLDDQLDRDPRVQELMVQALARGRGLESMLNRIAEESAERAGRGVDEGTKAAPLGQPSATPAEPGSPEEAAQALRELRQPLTPQVAKPSQIIASNISG